LREDERLAVPDAQRVFVVFVVGVAEAETPYGKVEGGDGGDEVAVYRDEDAGAEFDGGLREVVVRGDGGAAAADVG